MNDPITQTLTAIGLTEKQSRVYLGLLRLGEATVAQLAQAIEFKRPIVYVILDDLMQLGYVSELPHQKVRRFTASDPSRVYHNIAAAADNLKFFLPLLHSLRTRSGHVPFIEVHEKAAAIAAAYRDIERSRVSRYLSSYTYMQKHFPEEVARWVRRGNDKKDQHESRHILTNDPASQRFAANFPRHPRHQFRFVASPEPSPTDIAILQGIVTLTSFDPLFLVVIHSEPLARVMAAMYDAMWKSLAPRRS